jgi:hypothetical protein
MSQSLSRQQNVAVEHVFGIDGSHSPSQNDECGISVDRAGNPPRRHTALHGLNFELGDQEPGGILASRLQGKTKSSVDNSLVTHRTVSLTRRPDPLSHRWRSSTGLSGLRKNCGRPRQFSSRSQWTWMLNVCGVLTLLEYAWLMAHISTFGRLMMCGGRKRVGVSLCPVTNRSFQAFTRPSPKTWQRCTR